MIAAPLRFCSRICGLAVLALLLAGCAESGPVGALDEYLTKLERALEQGAHPVADYLIPRMPAARELQFESDMDSIDLVEFLQIRECKLQQLVAERNSVLGKLALPSQRLVYELRFLEVAEDCLRTISKENPELAAALREVVARKRERLPEVIFAATLGSEEFREFWQPGNEALPETVATGGPPVLALRELSENVRAWLGGNYSVDGPRLEALLDVIRRGDGGLQLKAWMLVRSRLDVATGVLQARLQRLPLCTEGMHSPAAEIFENVVKGVFVARIQPFVARLSARYYELLPEVRVLEELLIVGEPRAYADWRQTRDEELAGARAALRRHITAMNPLLEQCNLIPTRTVASI